MSAYSVVITHDNESLARIYGPTHVFLHPSDGRIQLSPVAEPITDYWEALRTFNLASGWMDDAMISGDRPGRSSTVTFRGPRGMFRSHTFATGERVTLAKPAHPNLMTNV